ncbi:MAG: SUMF1/EgtB/PvdO family nonheme iron enzyme [Gaiellaceae bacterium]
MTIPAEAPRDPWSPRPIDRPTPVAAGAELDGAKIFAAPDDPAEWPRWREDLVAWRERARTGYSGALYDEPAFAWTQSCFSVALVWLWDELLYDFEGEQFIPKRFVDAAAQFGGFDGVVLWHAYPVIGIDDRNQFDWYRDVPGIRELVADLQAADVRVFVDYNPWDVGTRREPADDAQVVANVVAWLGADGVFLDTMKEAPQALRAALDAIRPGIAFEGESTLPLARVADHHLSWAQWFADSPVPGVIRARWFEQRHMLHHTRRWNRDHAEELQSSWLNGTGMLVWDVVFGVWVGWNDRDRGLLRTMVEVQRRNVDQLTRGEWTPLAARSDDLQVVGSRWRLGDDEVWALANRADEPFEGTIDLDGRSLELTVPARGIAALEPGDRLTVSPAGLAAAFPARPTVRVEPPWANTPAVPERMVECPVPGAQTAVFRRRETGTYGDAPYVEEWKPLPPRLHDLIEVERPQGRGRFAIGVQEVAGADGHPLTRVTLDEARAYAAERGARLPTEDEWQAAAAAGLLERLEPHVWNWTESEHRDGRTRFAILKGGSHYEAPGSDWYADGGERGPEHSLKLLLVGGGLQRSPSIGFRLAVDLP